MEFPELWCAVKVRCRDNQRELDESGLEMGGEEKMERKSGRKFVDGGGWMTERGGEECVGEVMCRSRKWGRGGVDVWMEAW